MTSPYAMMSSPSRPLSGESAYASAESVRSGLASLSISLSLSPDPNAPAVSQPLKAHPSVLDGIAAPKPLQPELSDPSAPAPAAVDPAPPAGSPSAPAPAKRTAVIFQDACRLHRYSRTADLASIVERPERVRAVKTGVASAWARLEARQLRQHGGERWAPAESPALSADADADALERMMGGLGLRDGSAGTHNSNSKGKGKGKEVTGGPFDILQSAATLNVDHPALRFIHPLPNEPPQAARAQPPPQQPADAAATSSPARRVASAPEHVFSPANLTSSPWPAQLQALCRAAPAAILTPPSFSEIPPHLPQGDLYLSAGSEAAIFGALGAVCEAVDRVAEGAKPGVAGYDRAFVAIRPPGHHCCEAQPMGFCFVNNVAVAAAHAHQQHGIDRIVIIDIDLHHGNGTQEIAWRINASANAAALARSSATASNRASPRKGGSPTKAPSPPMKPKRDLAIMYASLHDVFSYPCEDGDPALVQAASINISGGHSQYIANVHLDSWTHEAEFHEKLYHRYRDGLLGAASEFCSKTAVEEDESARTLVILSAGFDASEHESPGMSRHVASVPTSFYHRFARDVVKFANQHAGGKVLAVLEGGYADRALCSGTLATLVGLAEAPRFLEKTFLVEEGDEKRWWDERTLARIEKACRVPTVASTLASARGDDAWLARTVEIFARIEGIELGAEARKVDREQVPARGMQLRERRPRGATQADDTPQTSPTRLSTKPLGTKLPAAVPIPLPATNLALATQLVSSTPLDPPAPGAPAKVKFMWKEGGIGLPRA